MGTRDELLMAVAARYSAAKRSEKSRILTKFAEISGYHRKHAERLLRREHAVDRSQPRPGRRVYDEAVREALAVLWAPKSTSKALENYGFRGFFVGAASNCHTNCHTEQSRKLKIQATIKSSPSHLYG
jgi:hypothetical protein